MRSHSEPRFTQIGIPLSFFSAKTRSYLRYKGIPFDERGPTLLEFAFTLERRTQAAALPVLLTPAGEWLQDTSVIIDTLEQRFPEPAVLPATPVLRFAAFVLELWADELWVPLAMHTRWSHPENIPFFVEDATAHLLPGLPRALRRAIARRVAGRMQSYMPAVGVAPQYHAVLDRFLQIQLDGLEAHFARHAFLLGERPSLADFSLAGALCAHLGRDPWSKRELVAPRARLSDWVERMNAPAPPYGDFLADDAPPPTLAAALRSAFDEQLPYLRACCEAVRASPVLPADALRAPRSFGPVDYPLAGGTHRRLAGSYPVWMVQRLMGMFAAMDTDAQRCVRDWLTGMGGDGLLALDPPPVRRVGLCAAHIGADAALAGSGRGS
jgi:glutathione S-transferase